MEKKRVKLIGNELFLQYFLRYEFVKLHSEHAQRLTAKFNTSMGGLSSMFGGDAAVTSLTNAINTAIAPRQHVASEMQPHLLPPPLPPPSQQQPSPHAALSGAQVIERVPNRGQQQQSRSPPPAHQQVGLMVHFSMSV
jgi:hypothetical protein